MAALLISEIVLFFAILGDSMELWVTLNAMGYNHALVQDEVAMFEVSQNATWNVLRSTKYALQ